MPAMEVLEQHDLELFLVNARHTKNVPGRNVLSDISRISGMTIIGAILDGERDPSTLAAMVQPEVQATAEDIAKSLEGNWCKQLQFVLRQEVELYRIYQKKIRDCDLELRKHLESFGSVVDLKAQPIGPQPKHKKVANTARTSISGASCIALPESIGRK